MAMAQRVNVILVDDLDGTDADETLTFGIDGSDYEIDLSSAHADELRQMLAPYIGVARRSRAKRRGGRSSGSSGASSSASARGRSGGGTSPAEIRQWARENGWEVPERGRVAADVREAYEAAH
jgi:hypothetical protein